METNIMELKYQCFKDYPNPYFIETGSYAGDGIQAALDSGFETIISLEVNPPNVKECTERFKNEKIVVILQGDSSTDLWGIISQLDKPITFWLDAHYSGEGSPIGIVNMPLLYELNQIRRHHIKTHTIIIDDVRCWEGVSQVRDFSLDNVFDTLMRINPKYQINYVDGTEPQDVLIASL
jgi:hypothetical protein